jgi:hypothetical protein
MGDNFDAFKELTTQYVEDMQAVYDQFQTEWDANAQSAADKAKELADKYVNDSLSLSKKYLEDLKALDMGNGGEGGLPQPPEPVPVVGQKQSQGQQIKKGKE